MSEESSRSITLQDLKAMMESMLQAQEQNFNRALEVQREQILGEVKSMMNRSANTSNSTEQTGREKEPIILDDNTPSESVVMSEFEKKWAERLQEMERTLKNIRVHDDLIDVDTLALFPGARLP